jgi:DNA-binding NarL/FixJ family response regulator
MKPSHQIRVLVVDDQEIVRNMLEMVLSTDPAVILVGTVSDGKEAVDSVVSLSPDVVIMDVKMPGMTGIAAAQQIRDLEPEVGIILLTAYEESKYIREFLSDDPRGKAYLLKHTLGTVEDLVRTIHDVDAGRTVLDPVMVEKLTANQNASDGSPLNGLTRRELEVLSLMAKAFTNNAIAKILYIQPRTVEHHVNSIFSKLNVIPEEGQHGRVQAVLSYLNALDQPGEEVVA